MARQSWYDYDDATEVEYSPTQVTVLITEPQGEPTVQQYSITAHTAVGCGLCA